MSWNPNTHLKLLTLGFLWNWTWFQSIPYFGFTNQNHWQWGLPAPTAFASQSLIILPRMRQPRQSKSTASGSQFTALGCMLYHSLLFCFWLTAEPRAPANCGPWSPVSCSNLHFTATSSLILSVRGRHLGRTWRGCFCKNLQGLEPGWICKVQRMGLTFFTFSTRLKVSWGMGGLQWNLASISQHNQDWWCQSK